MSDIKIVPGAEPFSFEGNEVGCLISHRFTGTTPGAADQAGRI